MGLRSGSHSSDCTIKSYIGTAYDNVKEVADNIDNINLIAESIKEKLNHTLLTDRNVFGAHPASAIDWSEYGVTAEDVANGSGSGGPGSGGDFNGGYIIETNIESTFDGGSL